MLRLKIHRPTLGGESHTSKDSQRTQIQEMGCGLCESCHCPFLSPRNQDLAFKLEGSTLQTSRKAGHLAIVLLLHVNRTLRNAKQRLVQEIWNKRRLFPTISTDDANHPSRTRQRNGLLVSPMNLENLRKQNADNAHCVCWVLRDITDSEAIDTTLRLSSTVRWFEYDDVDVDPPYDFILSSFQECSDPNKVLYPGMRPPSEKPGERQRAWLITGDRAIGVAHGCRQSPKRNPIA